MLSTGRAWESVIRAKEEDVTLPTMRGGEQGGLETDLSETIKDAPEK